MDEHPRSTRQPLIKNIRSQFAAGIIVVLPIGASILILVWLFSSIDNILQPLIKSLFGYNIIGVGFGATILLIYLVGVVTRNVLGKRVIQYSESLLAKVPIFRLLYTGIRQILVSFSVPDKTGFMQVVLVEFPRKGINSIGFITNEFTDKSGERVISVLIPTAPNPTTGFLQIMKEGELVRTKISFDDALKMIVSAGRLTPLGVWTNLPVT